MSSSLVKDQINKICQLENSFKETENICEEVKANAKTAYVVSQAFRVGNESTQNVSIDFFDVATVVQANNEMKALLEDYQCGIECIMSAYRERVRKVTLAADNHFETNDIYDSELIGIVLKQCEQIHEMTKLMEKAVVAEDRCDQLVLEHSTFLRKQNAVLRELHEFSVQHGNGPRGIRFNELNYKETGIQVGTAETEESDDNDDEDNADVITVLNLKLSDSDEKK